MKSEESYTEIELSPEQQQSFAKATSQWVTTPGNIPHGAVFQVRYTVLMPKTEISIIHQTSASSTSESENGQMCAMDYYSNEKPARRSKRPSPRHSRLSIHKVGLPQKVTDKLVNAGLTRVGTVRSLGFRELQKLGLNPSQVKMVRDL